MHWAIALTFILLTLTIFLRMNWMDRHYASKLIEEALIKTGQSLDKAELKSLSKAIREPMWQWHYYLGYILTGLFSIRFLLPLFGKIKFQNPFKKELSINEKVKRWVYILFYICVSISLITGLVIEFGPASMKKTMKLIHKPSIYYLVPFLIIHIGNVLYAEFTNQKGIISRVISGTKDNSKESKEQ